MSQAPPQRNEGTQLQRRVLSNVEVFAQSVGGIAPVLGAVAITPLLVSDAGSGAWLTVLLAMTVALAVGACLVTVAREHVSSGGVYNKHTAHLIAGADEAAST